MDAVVQTEDALLTSAAIQTDADDPADGNYNSIAHDIVPNAIRTLECLSSAPEKNGDIVIKEEKEEAIWSYEGVDYVTLEDLLSSGSEGVTVVCVYACAKCPQIFVSENELADHMTLHNVVSAGDAADVSSDKVDATDNSQFLDAIDAYETQCKTEEFNTRVSERNLKETKNYKCNDCHLVFSKNELFQSHTCASPAHTYTELTPVAPTVGIYCSDIKALTAIKQFACRHCGQNYASRSSLNAHLKKHVSGKNFQCDKCGKAFFQRSQLDAHSVVHSNIKAYKCGYENCSASFSRPTGLKLHVRVHTGEKPYSCHRCGRRFAWLNTLKGHLRAHMGIKPFKCNKCPKAYVNKYRLLEHQAGHNGVVKPKPYKCDFCKLTFRTPSYLEKHRLFHTGERPHKCNICGAGYVLLSSLRAHESKHNSEKLFQCDTCGKSYSNRSGLQSHLIVHSEDKPHVCKYCRASFKRAAELHVHTRCHTGQKPYKCEQCGVKFAQSSNLSNHLKIHSGYRPHKCGLCDKGFIKRSDLTRHRKSQFHQQRAYACQTKTTIISGSPQDT